MNQFAGRATTNFLIRRKAGSRSLDDGKLRRLLQYLGGEPTATGFAFVSEDRRHAAWEALCNRFGARYFEKHDEMVAIPDSM